MQAQRPKSMLRLRLSPSSTTRRLLSAPIHSFSPSASNSRYAMSYGAEKPRRGKRLNIGGGFNGGHLAPQRHHPLPGAAHWPAGQRQRSSRPLRQLSCRNNSNRMLGSGSLPMRRVPTYTSLDVADG